MQTNVETRLHKLFERKTSFFASLVLHFHHANRQRTKPCNHYYSSYQIMIKFLFLFCCFLFVNADWYPQNVPNPNKEPSKCGRAEVMKSMICDPDLLLSKDSADVVEGYINQGTSHGSYQLGVLLIKKMSEKWTEEHSNDIDKAGEEFAIQVFNKWGIGLQDKNDGILLFVSIDDRFTYISRGRGVQQKLSPLVLNGVISHMRPHLRSKNWEKALSTAVVEVNMIMEGKTPQSESSNGWFIYFVLLCIVAWLCYSSYRNFSRTYSLNRGRDALGRLMTEVRLADEEMEEEDGTPSRPTRRAAPVAQGKTVYASKSCPICLEAFVSASPPTALDGAGSASEGTSILNPKRPNALCCGHLFCFECLDSYLRTPEGTRCPICRAPVDGTPPAPQPPQPPHNDNRPPSPARGGGGGCTANHPIHGTTSNVTGVFTSWHRSSELHYRLHRMRLLYPDTMDTGTMGAIAAGIDSRSMREVERAIETRSAAVQSIINEARSRESMRHSGSSGSRSMSFGGGMSSGGSGGRW